MRKFLILALAGAITLFGSFGSSVALAEEPEPEPEVEVDSSSPTPVTRQSYPVEAIDPNPERPGCSDFMCGSIQEYKPLVLPRRHSEGWNNDLRLCRHMALRNTPAAAREAVNEAILRFFVVGAVSLGARSAIGQDFDAALDSSIVGGASSAAGGAITGYERAKMSGKRTVYACLRIFGHPVLPPG